MTRADLEQLRRLLAGLPLPRTGRHPAAISAEVGRAALEDPGGTGTGALPSYPKLAGRSR